MFPYSLQARIEVTGFRPPEYISAICCGPEKKGGAEHSCYDEAKVEKDDFTSRKSLEDMLYRIQISLVWKCKQ